MKVTVSDIHSNLTIDLLREIYNYEPDSGKITRRVNRGKWKSGSQVGTIGKNGYRYVGINGKLYLAHRLIWLYVYGRWPVADIDHINRNRDDNRLANLREANRSENNINSKIQHNNTSGYKGAYYEKRRDYWYSEIWVNSKKIYLGSYGTAKEAGKVYEAAAKKYYGSFARVA